MTFAKSQVLKSVDIIHPKKFKRGRRIEKNITVFREIVENIRCAWNIGAIANLSLKQIRKKMCSPSLTNLGEKITNFGKFRMQNTLISLHNEEKEEDRENANGCQSYGIAT